MLVMNQELRHPNQHVVNAPLTSRGGPLTCRSAHQSHLIDNPHPQTQRSIVEHRTTRTVEQHHYRQMRTTPQP